jgi:hypothetical protein
MLSNYEKCEMERDTNYWRKKIHESQKKVEEECIAFIKI